MMTFEAFLAILLDLPGVARVLPPGFSCYLMPGARRPGGPMAKEVARRFGMIVQVIIDDVLADDDREADAVPKAVRPSEEPRTPVERSTSREARS